MGWDESLVDRSVNRIRQQGVVNFLFAGVAFLLPDRYSTRFYARGQVLADACSRGPSASHSPSHVVRACRYGFTQELYRLYRLDEQRNPRLYLDEVSRRHARGVNDRPDLLDDKREFHAYLRDRGFGTYLPDVYGHIENGTFVSDRYDSVREAAVDRSRIVIKGHTGSCGNDVYVCTADDEAVWLRGKNGKRCPIDEKIQEFESHMVTEYCEQAAYLDRIYPHAANTLRVLTLRTEDGVLVPAAVQRIGSERTGVLDNFSQGGLSAAVDIDTGELTEAAEAVDGEKPRWHGTHPDTGTRIAGTVVPGWDQITEKIRTVAAGCNAFEYVGWDLVVTSPGEFTIIEANSYPDPDVLQVHEPLLEDHQVRRFFQERGVIS
jgi:hypothetical protein